MSVSDIQKNPAYQVKPVQVDTREAKKELEKSLENNQTVDIVVTENNQTYVISSEKVNLSEIGEALPEMKLNRLRQYDRNEDGYLEEEELKYNWSEAIHQKAEEYRGEVRSDTLGMASSGNVIAAAFHATIGYAVGRLTVVPYRAYCVSGDYRPIPWNSHEPLHTVR